MLNKILEKFNAKLKNLDSINDLTLAVITKGSAGQPEYAFMQEILKDTDLLEKAIKIVISQNNPKFTSLLKSMLKHYIENCSDICRIDELTVYAEMLIVDEMFEKVRKVIEFLNSNLDVWIKNELDKFKDFDEKTKSLMFQVAKEYIAYFLAVFGILLKNTEGLSDIEAFFLAKETVFVKNPSMCITFGDFPTEALQNFLLFEH